MDCDKEIVFILEEIPADLVDDSVFDDLIDVESQTKLEEIDGDQITAKEELCEAEGSMPEEEFISIVSVKNEAHLNCCKLTEDVQSQEKIINEELPDVAALDNNFPNLLKEEFISIDHAQDKQQLEETNRNDNVEMAENVFIEALREVEGPKNVSNVVTQQNIRSDQSIPNSAAIELEELEIIDVHSDDSKEKWTEEMPTISKYNNNKYLESSAHNYAVQIPQVKNDNTIVQNVKTTEDSTDETTSMSGRQSSSLLDTEDNCTHVQQKSDSLEGRRMSKPGRVLPPPKRVKIDIDFEELVGKFLKNIQCPECSIPVDNLQDLVAHFRVEHPQGEFYVKCCDWNYKKLKTLKYHLLRHSERSILVSCIVCKRFWGTDDEVEKHIRLDHAIPEQKKTK